MRKTVCVDEENSVVSFRGACGYDIEALLSALLDAIDDWRWLEAETWLCVRVSRLDAHHHNKVFLTTIMPPTERGLHLSRRLSFYMLQQLSGSSSPKNPENIAVRLVGCLSSICLLTKESKLAHTPGAWFLEQVLGSIVCLCFGSQFMQRTQKNLIPFVC